MTPDEVEKLIDVFAEIDRCCGVKGAMGVVMGLWKADVAEEQRLVLLQAVQKLMEVRGILSEYSYLLEYYSNIHIYWNIIRIFISIGTLFEYSYLLEYYSNIHIYLCTFCFSHFVILPCAASTRFGEPA